MSTHLFHIPQARATSERDDHALSQLMASLEAENAEVDGDNDEEEEGQQRKAGSDESSSEGESKISFTSTFCCLIEHELYRCTHFFC